MTVRKQSDIPFDILLFHKDIFFRKDFNFNVDVIKFSNGPWRLKFSEFNFSNKSNLKPPNLVVSIKSKIPYFNFKERNHFYFEEYKSLQYFSF